MATRSVVGGVVHPNALVSTVVGGVLYKPTAVKVTEKLVPPLLIFTVPVQGVISTPSVNNNG